MSRVDMLSDTLSLVRFLIQTKLGAHDSIAWTKICSNLLTEERTLLPLSDLSHKYGKAYEAVVSARVASQRKDAEIVMEALEEAVEFLKESSPAHV